MARVKGPLDGRADQGLETRQQGLLGKAFGGAGCGCLAHVSFKRQLVIPARFWRLLSLQALDRLALNLEPDGLRLVPEDRENSCLAHALISCSG